MERPKVLPILMGLLLAGCTSDSENAPGGPSPAAIMEMPENLTADRGLNLTWLAFQQAGETESGICVTTSAAGGRCITNSERSGAVNPTKEGTVHAVRGEVKWTARTPGTETLVVKLVFYNETGGGVKEEIAGPSPLSFDWTLDGTWL